MIQTKFFEVAFAGINWQTYGAVYAGRQGVETLVNSYLMSIDESDLIRVEYMDIKRLSGYTAPNEFIFVHAAIIYYRENNTAAPAGTP